MLRVVLDTNIVVSGLLSPRGSPAAILDAATSKQFRCFASESLIEEYRDVLTRSYLGLDPRRVAKFMKDFRKVALLVVPRVRLSVAEIPTITWWSARWKPQLILLLQEILETSP